MASTGKGRTSSSRRESGAQRDLPPAGTALGGLLVERFVGQGGMGHLLLARDPALGRPVAVKFLRRDLLGDAAAERRFRREGKALAAVDHPNVVRVYGVGTWKEWPFISMEFVEGTPLSRLVRAGPLSLGEALRIAEELASALAEVHARRIVHRDVTPANVLLRNGTGSVCLIDFGLSRPLDATQSSGGGVGTPYYMAPEQVTGRRPDVRADIYSFGATLFEAVAGQPPHFLEDTTALFHAILNIDAPLVRSLRFDAPRALEVLLARCLSRPPEFRPADGEALLDEVRALRGGGADGPGNTQTAAGVPIPQSVPRDPSEAHPFLGHTEKLAALRAALEEAEAGRGSVLLFQGVSGTGKSRLLREACRLARSRAADWIPVEGSEYARSPYRGVREALAERARTLGAGDPAAVETLVREADPGNEATLRVLRRILEPETDPGSAPGRSDALRALAALLRAVICERPAILAVDDAHLLDEGSLDFLASVAEEVRSWPLVVAIAFRPPAEGGQSAPFAARLPLLQAAAGARGYVLGPLSEGAVAALVHRALRLSEEESCRLAPLLYRKSGGNPLYLLECLRLLQEEGHIEDEGTGQRIRSRISRLELPPRLQEVALRRLEGLPPREREILGALSVDPAGLPVPVLARCLEAGERDVLRVLQRLVTERGLVARSERGFSVPHAEIREAVYGDLLPELRAAYHAEAARGIGEAGGPAADPARLARHLRLGGDPSGAVPLLAEAARTLREAHSAADALALLDEALPTAPPGKSFELEFERALALATLGEGAEALREMGRIAAEAAGEERARALLALSRLENDRGAPRRSWEHLEEALPLAVSPELRLRVALDRAQVSSRLGMEGEAAASLEAAESLASGPLPPRLRLSLWSTRGSVLWRSGNAAGARDAWAEGLGTAEAMNDQANAARLLSNLSLACEALGLAEEAVAWARKAADRASLLGATRPLVHAQLQLSGLLAASMDLDGAGRVLEEAASHVEETDSDEFRVRLAEERAVLALIRGRPQEALEWTRGGLLRTTGVARLDAGLRLRAAEALLAQGLHAEALAEARSAAPGLEGEDRFEERQEAMALAAWCLAALGTEGPERAGIAECRDWRSPAAAAWAARLAAPGPEREERAATARTLCRNPLQRRRVEEILAAADRGRE